MRLQMPSRTIIIIYSSFNKKKKKTYKPADRRNPFLLRTKRQSLMHLDSDGPALDVSIWKRRERV